MISWSSSFNHNWIFLIIVLYICINPSTCIKGGKPPSFVVQPEPLLHKRAGESMRLECEAVGRPLPEITWLKDGSPVKTSNNGIEINSKSFSIESLKGSDRGKYTCRAQSVEGLIQASTILHIQAPPSYTIRPTDTTTTEGEDVSFTCEAEGYPERIVYSWLYNNMDINLIPSLRTRISVIGDTTLVIYNVVKGDGGIVSCEVDNGYGSPQLASAKLVVQFAARVKAMPSVSYGGFDLETTLECPHDAEPPVNMVVWRKSGKLLAVQQNPRYSTNQIGSLVIRSTQTLDGGRYTCKPINLLGSQGESLPMQLIVKDPPYFTIAPEATYEAEIGHSLVVSCGGSGDPLPRVRWKKLGNSDGVLYRDVHGQLIIDSINAHAHGKWQCFVENKVASISTDVIVLVKYTSPHPVLNLRARALSGSSVQIKWIAGYNGGYPQMFELWYKDMMKNDWLKIDVLGNKTDLILTNLHPNTEYEIAILSTNKLGSGDFSETVHVKTFATTKKPKPISKGEVATPQGLYSTVTKEGLVMLSWRQPSTRPFSRYSKNNLKESLLGFLLEYKVLGVDPDLNDNADKTFASGNRRKRRDAKRSKRSSDVEDWKTLLTSNNDTTSALIGPGDLYRDQIYEFRVLAVSDNEYSEPSKSIKVSTKGLLAYPCYQDALSNASLIRHPVILGVLGGICFMAFLIILLFVIYCKRRIINKRKPIDSEEYQDSLQKITHNEMKNRTNKGYESNKIIVDLPPVDNIDSKPLLSRKNTFKRHIIQTSPVQIMSSYSADHISNFNCKNGTSSSDRSSVKLRRETVARILEEQLKRRSLNDQMRYKIKQNAVYRGGIRSASTSPERNYLVSTSYSRPERLNITDPGILSENRRYYPKYSQPIQGSNKKQMFVFSRKIRQKLADESFVSSRASSGSPVFGIVGTEHLSMSPINFSGLNETASSNYNGKRHVISASANPYNKSFDEPSPTHRIYNTPFSPTSPIIDDVFTNEYSRCYPPKSRGRQTISTSSPKNKDDLSPNRVVARKTVAYCKDDRKYNVKNNYDTSNSKVNRSIKTTTSSNISFKEQSATQMSVFTPNSHIVTKDDEHLLKEDNRKEPRRSPNKRNSWSQRQIFVKDATSIAKTPAKTRNSYSYGNRELVVYCDQERPLRRTYDGTDRVRYTGIQQHKDAVEESNVEIDCSNSNIEVRVLGGEKEGVLLSGRRPMDSINNPTSPKSENISPTPTKNYHRFTSTLSPTREHPSTPSRHYSINKSHTFQGSQNARRSSTKKSASVSTPHYSMHPSNLLSGRYSRTSSKAISPQACVASSGYDSQNTSNTSTSPPSSKTVVETNSRKDTSSVEDNYEWDSELAMEKEILEALRHFETHKKDGPLSEELLSELHKFTKDRNLFQGPLSPNSEEYTKDNIARRCAALRAEFLHYQKMQQLDEPDMTS